MEELLELIDRIESIEQSMKMPIDAKIHLECVSEFLTELKEKLKDIAGEK